MCKYCENISGSWQIEGQEYDVPPLEYLVKSGIELIIKDGFIYAYCQCGTNAVTEIDFCPKCGNPLGEVKPLTVEQLAERVGKPIWCEWLQEEDRAIEHGKWFTVVSEKDGFSVKCPLDFGSHVCKLNNYGIGWLAFDREPKGEAE